MKAVYVNAQWQGGADLSVYDGAEEMKAYLVGQDYTAVPVSVDETDMTVRKNGIRGVDVLSRQMHTAYERLLEDAPDKIFTLGGGCDADVPAIVYLSKKYQRDLTVIWLDAHGDLNTPEESVSSLFYGMPLRSVMDSKCFGLLSNEFPLCVSQVIHIGGRDFDDTERAFIKESKLTAYHVQDVRGDNEFVRSISRKIQSGHIYIHLDLDVMDPSDFPDTPLPVDGGLHFQEVSGILNAFTDRLAGIGIYEYAPAGSKSLIMEKLIRFGLAL